MGVKVILFGSLIDATEKNQMEVENIFDVDTLKLKLLNDFPKLTKQKFVVAVHKQVVSGNFKLNNGDTVALLPPFAGG